MGKKKSKSSTNSTLTSIAGTSKSQSLTSVQLASLNAQGKPRISSFDPSATYFACSVPSIDKVHVKVWSCDSGDLLGEVKSFNSHLGKDDSLCIPSGCQVTCLSWGFLALEVVPKGNDDKSSGKASKKKPKSTDLSLVLFIGLDQGGIYLFSPKTASLFGELSASAAPHSSPIHSIQVASQGNAIYSFAVDGSMASWSIHSQNELSFSLESKRSFSWAKGASKALFLPTTESFILCNRKIAVFSLSDFAQFESQLSGHATDICSAALSPSFGLLATCAVEDRFCMIWNLKKSKLIASVPLECNAVAVGFLDEHTLWIEGENGEIAIFSLNETSCLQVSCIRFVDKAVSKGIIPLSGIITTLVPQTSLVVARGNATCGIPIFERINRWEKGMNCLERTLPAFSNIIGPASRSSTSTAQSIENVPVQGTAASQSLNWRSQSSSTSENHLACTGPEALPSTQQEFHPASIVATLHQAIKSRDSTLFASVIGIGDLQILSNTTQRISPSFIIPFLNLLSEQLSIGKIPLKGIVLWIKELIGHQVAYFASTPAASEALSKLYGQLEERTLGYGNLIGLMGKLDLLLAQSKPSIVVKEEELENEEESAAALVFGEDDLECEAFEECNQGDDGIELTTTSEEEEDYE